MRARHRFVTGAHESVSSTGAEADVEVVASRAAVVVAIVPEPNAVVSTADVGWSPSHWPTVLGLSRLFTRPERMIGLALTTGP